MKRHALDEYGRWDVQDELAKDALRVLDDVLEATGIARQRSEHADDGGPEEAIGHNEKELGDLNGLTSLLKRGL